MYLKNGCWGTCCRYGGTRGRRWRRRCKKGERMNGDGEYRFLKQKRHVMSQCGARRKRSVCFVRTANFPFFSCHKYIISLSSVAADSTGTILIATVEGGSVYRSTNGGATWTEMTGTRPASMPWTACVSNGNGSVLVVVADNGNGNSGVWSSTDGGASWTEQPALRRGKPAFLCCLVERCRVVRRFSHHRHRRQRPCLNVDQRQQPLELRHLAPGHWLGCNQHERG